MAVAWIITAIAAIIVMAIYVVKLQKINKTVDIINQGGMITEAPKHTDTEDLADLGGTQVAEITEPATEPVITTEPAPTEEPEPTAEPTPTAEPSPTPRPIPDDAPYYYDPYLDPNQKIIAFSFDDGPSQYTDRILEALVKYDAKATFFMVGYNLDYYKDQVVNVYNAGCQIGNHTTKHDNLKKGSKDQIKKWVFDNEKHINEIVPVGEIVVRPPYGEHNETVRSVVDRPMFNWSVDSRDWETRDAASIVKQIKQDAKDGYIILMHDIYEPTAEAVEIILPWLISEGYQVTCISNMFEARGEETENGHVYRFTSPAPTPAE